jgi:hypothetical protein
LRKYAGALHLANHSEILYYNDFGALHHYFSHRVAKSL